jgi:hypothetical protein
VSLANPLVVVELVVFIFSFLVDYFPTNQLSLHNNSPTRFAEVFFHFLSQKIFFRLGGFW